MVESDVSLNPFPLLEKVSQFSKLRMAEAGIDVSNLSCLMRVERVLTILVYQHNPFSYLSFTFELQSY